MTKSLCTLCNTELLDNLILCAGRCNKYFHYTCVVFSRTVFDGYKRVSGSLKWQCTNCLDDFNSLFTKLEDLTVLVGELKSSINMYGLVKSTIVDVFKEGFPKKQSSDIVAPEIHSIGNNKVLKK